MTSNINEQIIRDCILELDTIKRRLTGLLANKKVDVFEKPDSDEVYSYFAAADRPGEAIKFFNYYESNGWKVGKNRMKSWKHAASQWIARGKERENSKRVSSSERHDQATRTFLRS